MTGKSLKVIIAVMAACLLFTGSAVANTGTCNGSKAAQKEAKVKNNLKKVVVVKKPEKKLIGSVIGKTLLDTTEDSSSVGDSSSTPLAGVHLRLYVEKKTKWGISRYKTAYATKSDDSGVYTFKNVRPGSYILRVWSPTAVPVSDSLIKVTVDEDETVTVSDIHFVPRPIVIRPIFGSVGHNKGH